MSAEVLEGLVAFENLAEHEMYNGQSTGKYSVCCRSVKSKVQT